MTQQTSDDILNMLIERYSNNGSVHTIAALRALKLLRDHRHYASEFLSCSEKLNDTSCDLHDAQKKIARYQEALWWYADESNWIEKCDSGDLDGMNVRHEDPSVYKDNGQRAREALE